MQSRITSLEFTVVKKQGSSELKSYTIDAWNHLPRVTSGLPLKLESKDRQMGKMWPGEDELLERFLH